MNRNCYTYFLRWSNGKMYYGCRYAVGCDPLDLWVTYFTSSKVIPIEDPTEIRITKTFGNDYIKCRNHESRFLKRVNAVKSDLWYNRTDNDSFMHCEPHTEESIKKIKFARSKQILTKERNKKVSDSLKGRTLTKKHRENISNSTKGRIGGMINKKHNQKTKIKMSIKAKNRPSNSANTKWWNNGSINKRSINKPGDDFELGFLSKRWSN